MEHGSSSRERVLEFLLEQEEAVTRPDIAAGCELSRPTVFGAIQHLEQAGLVHETGQRRGSPGRSAALFEMAPGAGTALALDIGGSNLRVAVADVRGRLLAELREGTRPGGPAIVAQANDLARKALATAGTDPAALTAVTVSVPGVVDADGKTVHFATNIDQPEPFDFHTPIADALGAPVILENNVNLAALGERWRGVGRDLRTFVIVAVGAGIGAGLIHDGRLLRGAHGASGEVAFLPFLGASRPIDLRAHDAAGGLNLLTTAQRQPNWTGTPPRTVEELFGRASLGEEPAAALVEEECARIAAVIATLCAVLDPQAIILTGGVGANDRLMQRSTELATGMSLYPPVVIRSELGDRASVVGGIYLATQAARSAVMRALDA
jgi:predicted NBD/HSP70 family sugar kinase/biotin operon repressor